jgi:hypothetical protein
MSVRVRFQHLDPVESHTVHGVYGEGFSGGLLSLEVDGERASGEERFAGPPADLDAELRLYFRFSAGGRIRWENLELQECDPAEPRLVVVACHHGPLASDAATMDYWERWLDIAGEWITRQRRGEFPPNWRAPLRGP